MQNKNHEPTLREMIELPVPYEVRISPDGKKAAYIQRETNWREDQYQRLVFVHDLPTGKTVQLTREGSSTQIEWIDAQTLAVLKTKTSDAKESQIFVFHQLAGEPEQVTDHKGGVHSFSLFAAGFLYLAKDAEREDKKRKGEFGTYTHFEEEDSQGGVFYTSLSAQRAYQKELQAIAEEEENNLIKPVITLSKLLPAPMKVLQLACVRNDEGFFLTGMKRDDLVYIRDRFAYYIKTDPDLALTAFLETKNTQKNDKGEETKAKESSGQEKEDLSYLGTIQELPICAMDIIEKVSPDGTHLLVSHQLRDDLMFTQSDLCKISVAQALAADNQEAWKAGLINLTKTLDQAILGVQWTRAGIFGRFADHQQVGAFRIDGDDHLIELDFDGVFPYFMNDQLYANDAGQLVMVGANNEKFAEVYVCGDAAGENPLALKQVTDFNANLSGWDMGTVETLKWVSKDGTEIEGVLRKPSNYDPEKRYPLAFVVHGGPSWLSCAFLVSGEDMAYYPSVQFGHKDILVVKPNYRGSIGRGQAFQELNVNNLGVGDLWDLEGAIEHLDKAGMIDTERIGCMGWSQGGYISAFVGLRSDKFKAVSVGAGISDWYTYHISNDIPQFTDDYLSASPFEDRGIYEKTAPITGLETANTPMLIQHGSDDLRVPLSNAKELYRALKFKGVDVELYIYPGMGHPITKPRENHAVMKQNYEWFCKYLLDDEK